MKEQQPSLASGNGGVGEPYAASARAGSVMGADEGGGCGHQFLEPRRALRHVVSHPAKVLERAVEAGVQAEAIGRGGGQGCLQVAEEAAGAGESQGHGPELAEQLVIGPQGQSFASRRDGIQQGGQPLEAPRGESNCHCHRIKDPAKNFFAGFPGGVALQKFFGGDGLGAGRRIVGH